MAEDERRPVLTGGCQCGAVRYALYAMPVGEICHCRMCQKAVGGPFAALANLAAGDLAWTRGVPAVFASSNLAERGFCAACGTPLTYRGLEDDRIDVTIGSLDLPALVAPQRQYGVEGRLGWFETLAALPGSVTEAKYSGVVSRQCRDGDG